MSSAASGKLEFESSRTQYAMEALTDSGDATTFTSNASRFSRYSGEAPDVRPNGVVSGCVISTNSSNDTVSVSAGTVYVAGVLVTVSAGTAAITRDVSPYLVTSITVNGSGTLAATAGTDHASAFSETRAADGGPPLLATTVVELGQVRTTSASAGVILASEIKQVLNVHRESAYFPVWTENDSDASITFNAALMLNHTGPVAKVVEASYSDPSFSEQVDAENFVPVTESKTQASTTVYNGTVGATSTALQQGSFTFYPREGLGVTDQLIGLDGENLWFRFYPNRSGTRYVQGQAILGAQPSYPADDNISVACTLSGNSKFTYHAS